MSDFGEVTLGTPRSEEEAAEEISAAAGSGPHCMDLTQQQAAQLAAGRSTSVGADDEPEVPVKIPCFKVMKDLLGPAMSIPPPGTMPKSIEAAKGFHDVFGWLLSAPPAIATQCAPRRNNSKQHAFSLAMLKCDEIKRKAFDYYTTAMMECGRKPPSSASVFEELYAKLKMADEAAAAAQPADASKTQPIVRLS